MYQVDYNQPQSKLSIHYVRNARQGAIPHLFWDILLRLVESTLYRDR